MAKDFISDEEMEKMQPDDFISDEQMDAIDKMTDLIDSAKAFAASAADTATMGYGPNIIAGVKTGSLSSPEYMQERDELNQALQELREESPTAALAGDITGGVASAVLPGGALAKGAGLGTKLLASVAIGAGIGALQDTPDIPGEAGEIDAEERAKQAATGAGVGLITQGAGSAISKIIPDSVEQQFKALGPFKKQAKKARIAEEQGRGKTAKDIVEFGRKEGIFKFGRSAEEMYDEALASKRKYGEELRNIYDKSSNQLDEIRMKKPLIGDRFSDLKASAIQDIEQRFKYAGPDKDKIIQRVSEYFDNIDEQFKGTKPSLLDLHEVKQELATRAKYAADAAKVGGEIPNLNSAWKRVERIVNNSIEDMVSNVPGEAGKRLKQANKNYSLAAELHDIVANRVDSVTSQTTPFQEIIDSLDPITRMRSSVGSIAQKVEALPPGTAARASAAQMLAFQQRPTLVEGFPSNMTQEIDPADVSLFDMEITKNSNLTPTQKAKRLQLLRKHGRIYLGQ